MDLHHIHRDEEKPLVLIKKLGSDHGNWSRILAPLANHREVLFPSQAHAAQDKFPNAELHWFDDCGHFPQWDQPEETVTLILSRTG